MKVLANTLDSGHVQFLLLRTTGLVTELPGHLSLPILGHGSIVEGHERSHRFLPISQCSLEERSPAVQALLIIGDNVQKLGPRVVWDGIDDGEPGIRTRFGHSKVKAVLLNIRTSSDLFDLIDVQGLVWAGRVPRELVGFDLVHKLNPSRATSPGHLENSTTISKLGRQHRSGLGTSTSIN